MGRAPQRLPEPSGAGGSDGEEGRGALPYRDDWPSLFVGPAGSGSGLHVDPLGSNFWMLLIAGRKRWAFFDRADRPLLYGADRRTPSRSS